MLGFLAYRLKFEVTSESDNDEATSELEYYDNDFELPIFDKMSCGSFTY
jgi:hypothetical protein